MTNLPCRLPPLSTGTFEAEGNKHLDSSVDKVCFIDLTQWRGGAGLGWRAAPQKKSEPHPAHKSGMEFLGGQGIPTQPPPPGDQLPGNIDF